MVYIIIHFGITRNGKSLTAKGIKPICPFHQVFQSTYLFGAFSPLDGTHFLLELPFCNSDNFQMFLNEFSQQTPEEFKLIVLDNGAFHHAKKLNIPNNIALVFLLPYSPELNPAEKMWAKFKRDFSNRLFKSLDDLSNYLENICRMVNKSTVKTTCAFQYIFVNNFWSIL